MKLSNESTKLTGHIDMRSAQSVPHWGYTLSPDLKITCEGLPLLGNDKADHRLGTANCKVEGGIITVEAEIRAWELGYGAEILESHMEGDIRVIDAIKIHEISIIRQGGGPL